MGDTRDLDYCSYDLLYGADWDLPDGCIGDCCWVAVKEFLMMENQMEKKMEHEMETGGNIGVQGTYFHLLYWRNHINFYIYPLW